MDVEKMIEAAKICSDPEGNCEKCPYVDTCTCGMWPAEILALRDHYEARLKAERVAVIAEAREWADQAVEGMVSSDLASDWDNGFHRCYGMLKSKLFDMSRDSMEPDKGEAQ